MPARHHRLLRAMLPLGLLAASHLYAGATNAAPWTITTVLDGIPPLTHDATGRWPLITWEPMLLSEEDKSFQQGDPLPVDTYRELLKRGLTQAIRMNTNYLRIARALQEAGAPVIMMEGNGGDGPLALEEDFRHHLPKDYPLPKDGRVYPCPMITNGWVKQAELIRQTMKAYKASGVTVNAAWLDWEVEPLTWNYERYRQSKACPRCRAMFPKGILWNFLRYLDFVKIYRQQLFSDYLAAPILEIFPDCSTSNWDSMFSTDDQPSFNWYGDIFPPMDIGRFSASMPAVYASNASFTDYWYGRLGAPFRHLRNKHYIGKPVAVTDRVYTHVMLGEFSADARNALKMAPDKQSIPWVSGFVIDNPRTNTPVLSRGRYREILRHVWLRGADGMQVFNPRNPDHPEYMRIEVEDAAAIYDEMLAYRRFLDKGVVMNTAWPAVQDTGVIWSGLCLTNEAVVRAFTQGDKPLEFKIAPWPASPKVSLTATPAGATYILSRGSNVVAILTQDTPPKRTD